MVTSADSRFGRYELLELLGAGGMGEVYRARMAGAEGFRTHVALKRIYPHLGNHPEYRELFVREAKVAAELRHPNIVQVLDLGVYDGGLFIAMEYVRGLDVASFTHRLGIRGTSLAHGAAAVIAFDVLEALDYAHGKRKSTGDVLGIVHQDISPQNILLDAESGLAKLCDFGIVHLRSEQGTTAEAVRGKVTYMAPEQARGEALDGRADLFALGAVLFRLLADRPLLDDVNEEQRLARCRRGDFGDVRRALTDVEPQLAKIVERAVEPKPRDRYQDAASMRADLEAWLLGVDPRGQRARLKQMVGEATVERGGSFTQDAAMEGTPIAVSESEGWTRLVRRASMTKLSAATLAADGPTRGARVGRRSKRAGVIGVGVAVAASTAIAGAWVTRQTRTRAETPPRETAVATAPEPLQPPPVPAPPPETQPAPRPVPPPAKASTSPSRTRHQEQGSLTLNAIPWAKVTVDGKLLAKTTPIVGLKLASGKHTVVLEGPERRETLVVNIRPRRTLTKLVDLR